MTVEVIQEWLDKKTQSDPLFKWTGQIRTMIIKNKSDQQITRTLESKFPLLKDINQWEPKLSDKIKQEKLYLIAQGKHMLWDTKLPQFASTALRE